MFPKHAHSAIICGATGCGKTEFVLDLLETEYKGLFEYIIVTDNGFLPTPNKYLR